MSDRREHRLGLVVACVLTAVCTAWGSTGAASAQATQSGGPDRAAMARDGAAAFEQANAAFAREDWAEAARLYRIAWQADRKLKGRSSAEAAIDAHNVALAQFNGGALDEAAAVRIQAIDERRTNPGGGGAELADLYNLDGDAHWNAPEPARASFQTALDLNLALTGRDVAVARAATGLTQALLRLNRPAEAVGVIETGLAAATAANAPGQIADALVARSRLHFLMGRPIESEADVRRALAIVASPSGATMSRAFKAGALDVLASTLMRQGRFSECADVLIQAIDGWDALGPTARLSMADSMNQLGWARTYQGLLPEGEALFRRALAVAVAENSMSEIGYVNASLGWNLHLQKRYAEAEPLLRQAPAYLLAADGLETTSYSAALTNYAGDLQAQGRHAEALPAFRLAYDSYVRTVGADNPDIGWTLNAMAKSAAVVEGAAAADPLFRRGLDMALSGMSPGHPEASERAVDYSRHLIRTGRPVEAMSILRPAGHAALTRIGGERRQSGAQRGLEPSRDLFRLQVQAAWTKSES